MITVGSKKGECASLSIFNGPEMTMSSKIEIKDEFVDPKQALCFTDIIKVISADNLIENIVIGSNRGGVTVYGMPPRFLREDP